MRFRPEQYDSIVRRIVEGTDEEPGSLNMLVPYFLMAAHAYEEMGDPFLTDGGWDWLCAQLDTHWDEVEHRHKHLIDRAALATGTASYLVGNLPSIIVHATHALLRDYSAPKDVGRIEQLPDVDADGFCMICEGGSCDACRPSECRYCANTGWFYGMSDLGPCTCPLGDERANKSVDDLLGIPAASLEGLL